MPRVLVTLVTEVTVTMGECVDGVGGPGPGQSREELRLADKLDRTLLTNTGDRSNVLRVFVSFGLLLLMLCNPGPDNQ